MPPRKFPDFGGIFFGGRGTAEGRVSEILQWVRKKLDGAEMLKATKNGVGWNGKIAQKSGG